MKGPGFRRGSSSSAECPVRRAGDDDTFVDIAIPTAKVVEQIARKMRARSRND